MKSFFEWNDKYSFEIINAAIEKEETKCIL